MTEQQPVARFGRWFIDKALLRIVEKFYKRIHMGRRINKPEVYKLCSWWWRFSRRDARRLFTAAAQEYDGVKFSNRGLWINKDLLDQLDAAGHT